ncbi:MAG: EAL domain-containing protein [Eubacteriales bacterium]|nr:EAL domain-containing protein [Eubacteriales bacterium]
MNEEKFRMQFRRSVLLCVAAGVSVLIAAIFILKTMYDSRIELVKEQMMAELTDYNGRIVRQIDKDFQTLYTIASFIQSSGIADDPDMASFLLDANFKNEFVTMGYFNEEGIGDIAHLEYGIEKDIDYHVFNDSVEEAMDMAYSGQQGLSKLFRSQVSNKLVYVYCVPVVRDGIVRGVLCASDKMEIFDTIFNERIVLNGNGSVHLIGETGRMLLSSDKYQEGTELFSGDYFSEKDERLLQEVIKENEKYAFATMNYNNKKYMVCLTSLRVNDWYLLCIHDNMTANKTLGYVMRTMLITFLLLLCLVLCLLFFIYHILTRSNQSLTRLAYKDWLTGADNMLQFEKNLEHAQKKEGKFCIAVINVRQFKFMNEIFGKEFSDRLLCSISKCIDEMMGDGEFFARESADLFYVYLLEKEEVRIRERIEALFLSISMEVKEKRDYQLQMYAGAYIHDGSIGAQDFREVLMTRVAFAMEQCKKRPGEVLSFYNAKVHREKEMENYVETHMVQALSDGEFQVFLQPKVSIEDGSLSGAEALVRWVTKDGSMIFPDVFIPQFERNGFCVQLDLYMVRRVCKMLRAWMDEGLEPIPVSVNQTKLLFYQADYMTKLQECLKEYQIPAELITLEILEGLALEHKEEMNSKLRALRKIGFKISLDDFGSGYASFNTLGSLEIDELKLDRSFLLEISKNHSYRLHMIMSGVIDLSKRLYISTVAEGVETKEDEEMIRSMGCDFGQGYLYSRPLRVEDFYEKYMKERKQSPKED